jgi:hypothetical protein
VIDRLTHPTIVRPGGELKIESAWSNLGATPSYMRRQLAYRLASEKRVEQFSSDADVRKWLPGSWKMSERFEVPADMPAGKYRLEVAILDRAGKTPETDPLPPLQLGISGRRDDGWYALSEITVE